MSEIRISLVCLRRSLDRSIRFSRYPRAGPRPWPLRRAGNNYTHPGRPRGRESRRPRFLHNSGAWGGVGGRPPRRRNAPCWSATSCSPTDSLRSTIGARGLNFRVRNGTGCASPAMVADQQGAFQGYGRAVPSGPHSVTSDGPRGPLGIACMKRRARPISTARLNASQRLHLRPIELVVYEWPYRRENSSRDWLPA